MLQNPKYSRFKFHSLSVLFIAGFIGISNSILAFKPPTLSDYQRTDLAKLGIKKVVVFYEHKRILKKVVAQKLSQDRKDVQSIKFYDNNGFITKQDSFYSFGYHNGLQHFDYSEYYYWMTKKMTYTKIGSETEVRTVYEPKDNAQSTTVQTFNVFGKLLKEAYLLGTDTTGFTFYRYDSAWNCIEKETWDLLLKRKFKNTYKYTPKSYNGTASTNNLYKNVIIEDEWADSVYSCKTYSVYNWSGQLVEELTKNKNQIAYAYDTSGKKIRTEEISFYVEDYDGSYDCRKNVELYSYNEKGMLSQIMYFNRLLCFQPIDKDHPNDTFNVYYLPNGLINIKCNKLFCFRYTYYKN